MNAIIQKHRRILFVVFVFAFLIFLYALSRQPSVLFQGYVEGENLYLASSLEGKLTKKHVVRGQSVYQNQILFQIDPVPETLEKQRLMAVKQEEEHLKADLEKPRRKPEIEALKSEVQMADVNLSLANLRLKRYTELYQKQAVDLDHLNEIQSDVKRLEAAKNEAISHLEFAQLGARPDAIKAQASRVDEALYASQLEAWKLSQKTLTAPADGFIFDTYYQEGEFVPAGRPVAALLPLGQVRIEFFVPARLLPKLKINQTVLFRCEGRESLNKALIQYISPEAEYIPPLVYSRENSDKIVFRIKAKILEPALFKPGQPVDIVRIEDVS